MRTVRRLLGGVGARGHGSVGAPPCPPAPLPPCLILVALLLVLPSNAEGFTLQPRRRTVEPVPNSHFNRVDGFFLGIGVRARPASIPMVSEVQIKGGYGLSSHRWGYEYGARRTWEGVRGRTLGITVYDMVDTPDRWRVSDQESSMLALLFGVASRDYVHRSGYETYLIQNLGRFGSVTARYTSDEYESVRKRTDWSLYHRKRKKRGNWEIDDEIRAIGEGELNSVELSYSLRMGGDRWSRNATRLRVSVEYAGEELGGDFSFRRYWVEVTREYGQREESTVLVSAKGGLLEGAPPLQKGFHLGGIGTLPGYDYKVFSGDRMLLFRMAYRIPGDRMDVIPFADGGYAWPKGAGMNLRDLRWDAGVGLRAAGPSGGVTVNAVRPLGVEHAEWGWELRVDRTLQ